MENMIYQVVAKVEGQLRSASFTRQSLEDWYEVIGTHCNHRTRKELQGQPVLKGYMGPMYNGMQDGSHVIRYESKEAFERLSA